MNGYIKLHRKITEWEWYDDIPTKVVFLHLLLITNFKEKKWKGVTLKPGQSIIGREKLASATGLSERQVRTALKHLKDTGVVTIETTNKFTVVTIENWGKYQVYDDENDQQIDQSNDHQATSNRPPNDQQSTTKRPQLKNDKNDKNEKKEKNEKNVCIDTHRYGVLQNVELTDLQHDALTEKYDRVNDLIDKVSVWLPDNPRNDHYAICLKFAQNDNWPRVPQKYTGPTEETENPMSQEERMEMVELMHRTLNSIF